MIIKGHEHKPGSEKANAAFEKLLEDLKRYRMEKSAEEACKAYAKRKAEERAG